MRPRDSASFHQRRSRSRSRSRSPSQKRRVLWFSDKKISDSFVLMTPIYYFRGHKRSYDSAFIRIWFQILRPWKLAFSGWLRRKGSRYCQALLLFPSRRNKRLTMSPFIRFYNYITACLRPSVSRCLGRSFGQVGSLWLMCSLPQSDIRHFMASADHVRFC